MGKKSQWNWTNSISHQSNNQLGGRWKNVHTYRDWLIDWTLIMHGWRFRHECLSGNLSLKERQRQRDAQRERKRTGRQTDREKRRCWARQKTLTCTLSLFEHGTLACSGRKWGLACIQRWSSCQSWPSRRTSGPLHSPSSSPPKWTGSFQHLEYTDRFFSTPRTETGFFQHLEHRQVLFSI